MEDGKWWPVGGSLIYNTVLQLDRFCRKQRKWVKVACVLLFFSLQNMPDICPKGIDLGVTLSASSCPPILPPYPGLQTEQTESQGPTPSPTPAPGSVAFVSVETQTEIQTAQVEVQTIPVSV